MVDRRDRRSSRTTRRPARAAATGRKSDRANTGRKAAAKTRAKATRRARPAPGKTAPKTTRTLKLGASGRKSTPPPRPLKSRTTKAAAPAPPALSLPESVATPPLAQPSTAVPAPPSMALAGSTAVPVRGRRRRGPRVKFTRWLYSEELYRQLGVSPRGQALVCRELRAERDGTWSARVAAVPAGFFEAAWVTVPPEVVVPVARPKPADTAH